MLRTQKAIREAERRLGSEGRVLVRWSGTEPKLRVMIEGPNSSEIKRMADQIAEEAKRDIG
jgi:phosphoglucosamine mutase